MPVCSELGACVPYTLMRDRQKPNPAIFYLRYLPEREARAVGRLVDEATKAEDEEASKLLTQVLDACIERWEGVTFRGTPIVFGVDKETEAFLHPAERWELALAAIKETSLQDDPEPPPTPGVVESKGASIE